MDRFRIKQSSNITPKYPILNQTLELDFHKTMLPILPIIR